MGQVVCIDFKTRKVTPASFTSEVPSCVSNSVTGIYQGPAAWPREDHQTTFDPREGQRPDSRETQVAVPATTESLPPKNLVQACADMRAHTDALVVAINDLKRASAGLADLPRLARELCNAAR